MIVALVALLATGAGSAETAVRLPVPVIRQAPERCGPAALRMVLGLYGADSMALAEAERAYDPVLRGTLITDLAAAARRGGFAAAIASPSPAALDSLLAAGVPPILLVGRGVGPLVRGHYAVLVGVDRSHDAWFLHDGAAAPRRVRRDAYARRWRAAGGQALIVRDAGVAAP